MIFIELIAGIVLALIFHEGGHYVMARCLGYPARLIVDWRGIGIQWGSDEVVSSNRDRLLVAVAGAGGNVVLAIVGFSVGLNLLAAVSLGIGLAQLIPFGSSDGAHVLQALVIFNKPERGKS